MGRYVNDRNGVDQDIEDMITEPGYHQRKKKKKKKPVKRKVVGESIFGDRVLKSNLLSEMVADFADHEDLSEDEYGTFLDTLPHDLTYEGFVASVTEYEPNHPCLIIVGEAEEAFMDAIIDETLVGEAQSTERRRELRQQEQKKKALGTQFYAAKSASREDRLNAASNRAAVFKWNRQLKRWEPRKKRLDPNKLKLTKIKRSQRFKSRGTADKASKRAANLRKSDTSRGVKLGKNVDLSRKRSDARQKPR